MEAGRKEEIQSLVIKGRQCLREGAKRTLTVLFSAICTSNITPTPIPSSTQSVVTVHSALSGSQQKQLATNNTHTIASSAVHVHTKGSHKQNKTKQNKTEHKKSITTTIKQLQEC